MPGVLKYRATYWSCVRGGGGCLTDFSPSQHTFPYIVAMANIPLEPKGINIPKESVFKTSKRWFRDDGRSMVAGKSGGS